MQCPMFMILQKSLGVYRVPKGCLLQPESSTSGFLQRGKSHATRGVSHNQVIEGKSVADGFSQY